MFQRRRKLRLAGVAAVAAIALLAAGCGSSSGSSSSGGTPVKGGTATVDVISGNQANYIFPFLPIQYFSVYNSQDFQWLMYRPLYMFGGNNTAPTVNYPLSPANAPVYSNGGKTITISMKGWKWSNGETVNAADVIFWLHMLYAEYANWAGGAPGGIPFNLSAITSPSPNSLVLTLKKPYSSLWYTYNELSQVTPMPMSWDVTKAGAAPGSGGCTTDTASDKSKASPSGYAKCVAVYNFLTAQAKDTSSYASPTSVWAVSDGPWKLSSFDTSGNDSFVPNTSYSGSPKPQIDKITFKPYTSTTAEFTGLKAGGQLDLGLIPSEDLPVKPVGQILPSTNPAGPSYTMAPNYAFSFDYYQINFNNPTFGPVFKQLYFRQAMEYLDDQAGMAKSIYRGYGYATTGPAPNQPANQWLPPAQQGAGPYPFSITKATSLLTSHGWTKQGGVMTCTNPSLCGAGVKQGQQLKFTFDYASGSAAFTQEAEIYKSDAAKAGVILNTNSQTFNTIIGEATPCSPGPKCGWQMLMYGGWVYSPDYEPTGEALFQTGAGSNSGSYSDPQMDNLINQTTTSGSLAVYHNFATYAAQQLPFIYMPNLYNIEAVSTKLHGVTFNPLGTFLPEYWFFTK